MSTTDLMPPVEIAQDLTRKFELAGIKMRVIFTNGDYRIVLQCDHCDRWHPLKDMRFLKPKNKRS